MSTLGMDSTPLVATRGASILLALVVGGHPGGAVAASSQSLGDVPSGIEFRDVTAQVGLGREGATFSAAAADFNRDGSPDLAVSNHNSVSLFRNREGLEFEDATHLGVFEPGDTHGVSWVDLNADGWMDLYVSRGAFRGRGVSPNRFHRNLTGNMFRVQSLSEPLANGPGRGRSATPVDIDGDGSLDLMVMNFNPSEGRQVVAVRTEGGFQDIAEAAGWHDVRATNVSILTTIADGDGSERLFITSGAGADSGKIFGMQDGRFQDRTTDLGIQLPARRIVSWVAAGDVDNDGDIDLYYVLGACCEEGPGIKDETLHFAYSRPPLSQLRGFRFRASGSITVEVWAEGRRRHQFLKLGEQMSEVVGFPWAGETAASELRGPPPLETTQIPGVFLWRESDGTLVLAFRGQNGVLESASGRIHSSSPPTVVESWGPQRPALDAENRLFVNDRGIFVDRTDEAGVGDPGPGVDALFADFDNDGDMDLYVVNGEEAFQNSPNVVYENTGGGRFRDVTRHAQGQGLATGRGTSVLTFDYDGDGDLDLFLTNGGGERPVSVQGRYQLLQNVSSTGNWIMVKPEATLSNTMNLGASVSLSSDGFLQVRQVFASTGAFSTSSLPIHFGIGRLETATVRVVWPSGRHAEQLTRAGEHVVLREPSSR